MRTVPTLALLTALCAFGQTPAATTYQLPSPLLGLGPTWQRGANNPYAVDVNIAIRAGQTRFYSYSTVTTPIVRPKAGALPVTSSMTTGGGYVAFQSAGGSVSLVIIAQAGFSGVQIGSTVAPTFTGSLAVPIRLSKRLYLMPFARATNASTSTTSGALATAVLQPGVQLLYSLGK